MTTSFSASLEAAGQLIEDEMEMVFLGAAQDASELMTRRQESMWNSATGKQQRAGFDIGFVPVDSGELINSVEVRLDGSAIAKGGNKAPPDFAASLGGMTLDTVAEVVFTAEHARPMEYGFRVGDDDTDDETGDVDVPGRFFVLGAVQSWDEIVEANVRYIKE
ncbi:hypothetical protein JF540_22960 [Salipiger thiooxidans]|uniref:hypothetical protein n=1 Tax=Salipiger thiooxidans TaxID=282683 RepID=UPI001A8FC9A2|nr:hypothetical protein [Salipiger thiooxidans]MBN8189550.1 hypothetical protein [Salipiger thiooxidans]